MLINKYGAISRLSLWCAPFHRLSKKLDNKGDYIIYLKHEYHNKWQPTLPQCRLMVNPLITLPASVCMPW